MKITKIGHSCVLIEEAGARILLDPGGYSTGQNDLEGLHAVFITHQHQDHASLESIKAILAQNPAVRIYTNREVRDMLGNQDIDAELLEEGSKMEVQGVAVEAFGHEHAVIYKDFNRVMNTSYLIQGRVFFPGDAFCQPGRRVEMLALPVAAPWMRLAEAIEYAVSFRPKRCFPIHDGMLKIYGPAHALPAKILAEHGIEFTPLENGGSMELP